MTLADPLLYQILMRLLFIINHFDYLSNYKISIHDFIGKD